MAPTAPSWRSQFQSTGSLTRRMILTAAAWIMILLFGGGVALDRVLTSSVEQNFDNQLEYVLTAMIASAEIGPDGEVRMNRPLGDQRFLEPNSGLYWQITGEGAMPFPSRSLWDRALKPPRAHTDRTLHFRDSEEFADEPLRIAERSIKLPDSDISWTFMVAQSRDSLDGQVTELRSVLVTSFLLLALGLIILGGASDLLRSLAVAGSTQGHCREMRSGRESRVTDALPDEVMPMVTELNALLDHNEKQAEESRRHAGNLAHALKTPLTVIMNSATAQAPDLDDTVIREATTMRRQVDHHLARARAVGRQGPQPQPALMSGTHLNRSSARSAGFIRTSGSTWRATSCWRPGSNGRTSTKCSATLSRMRLNMAAAASS